jgi:hypothetical protein
MAFKPTARQKGSDTAHHEGEKKNEETISPHAP